MRARDGEPPGAPDVSVFEGAQPSFRTDRWLLLRQHSPLLAHGRCFGRGDVLTEDGSLVASYA